MEDYNEEISSIFEEIEDGFKRLVLAMIESDVTLIGFTSSVYEEDRKDDKLQIPASLVIGVGHEANLLGNLMESYRQFLKRQQDEKDSFLN